ncbi:VanZ family protein [Saccharothrix violaceirubra]|uniref:VanZ family protein n=1 Tax=Saccharothrix violaceirubra TaxID=413306 RepID=A0A7W7T0V2_9PSEU|nr:VanZ family protein [Saccharothrix violaceirubra]MBB4964181.1 VanZ family protein [Saccharothrix violaceirubra]
MVSPRFLPFVAALSLSVVVLFMPQSGVPSSWPGMDKIVHLGLFALLAVTGLFALPRTPVLVGLVGYAVLSEVLQGLLIVLGRSADVVDGLTDVAGIGLGWLAYRVVSGIRSR